MHEITDINKYCYKVKGCSGYSFKGDACKNCNTTMDQIHEDGRNTYGTNYTYWCPNCGTILRWYDGFIIEEGDWTLPNKEK